MAAFKIIMTFLLMFIVALTKGCQLNQEQMEKNAMECAAHSPRLMLQIAEHMKDPSSLESLDFLCRYDQDVVDVFMCYLNKMKDCLPQGAKPMMAMILSRDRMLDTVRFICKHKKVLMSDCMNDHLQAFAQCYMAKLQPMISNAGLANLRTTDPKGMICKVIRSEEKCFRENKGQCSDDFVKMVIEVLEKFFPMSECPNVDASNKINSLLGSILVHGQPLKFKPGLSKKLNMPYVIKN